MCYNYLFLGLVRPLSKARSTHGKNQFDTLKLLALGWQTL